MTRASYTCENCSAACMDMLTYNISHPKLQSSILASADLPSIGKILLLPVKLALNTFHPALLMQDYLPIALQGLQGNVAVLDAELVSIDRQQQTVGLSNGQRVLYGALVITAGLDQARNGDLAATMGVSAKAVTSLKGAQKLSHEVCTALICMASQILLSWSLCGCVCHLHSHLQLHICAYFGCVLLGGSTCRADSQECDLHP